ncbi:MAG TPA: hypothetical protein VFF49_09100 [Thermodesulfobacteriota bacterium]|nr:hypothetical protein [Thermodesulfobacteriota bacterium]
MSQIAIGWIVFACVFGGALIGMYLRHFLPEHHLIAESKDIVNLGMGLVATMAALVLALLIGSAQGSFGTKQSEITQVSSTIILLDRVLALYGPETKDVRDLLRGAVVRTLNQILPEKSSHPAQLDPLATRGHFLFEKIVVLKPQNDDQRSIKAQALSLALDLGQTRWLMFEQMGSSISMPFLILLVFWITIIFFSFGLFAPPNATVIATLFVCALSVAAAIYMILELDQPFKGLVQISSAPLRDALTYLGQ